MRPVLSLSVTGRGILESRLNFSYEASEKLVTDGEVTLSMAIPVDSDGFLRRECPTCEREFKWLPASEDDEEAADVSDGGYFCPYCGVQAPADAWFTEAQLAFARVWSRSRSRSRCSRSSRTTSRGPSSQPG